MGGSVVFWQKVFCCSYTHAWKEDLLMDDFLTTYFILFVIGVIGFVLFWGTVIYFIIKFLRSDSGMSKGEKYSLLAKLFQAHSGRGGSSGDPMDTKAGGVAAGLGIDLNDKKY